LAEQKTCFQEQHLRNERIELTLLPELGCHWTRLRFSVKGEWLDFLVPVLDPETLRERPTFGSYMLAPWSNRIARGVFGFEGKRYSLRPNSRDGTAIHGDVRTRPWRVTRKEADKLEAKLDSRDFPDFNFPFAMTYEHKLELSGDRLRVELVLENVGRARAPVGFGYHPFARRRLTAKDKDVILVVPAEKVYPAEGCIPTAPAAKVSGMTDLMLLKPLGAPNLDHCFTGFTESYFRLIYPGTGVEVRFRMDPVFTHAVVYAPDESSGKAKDFVAVEPVTNANDGFNLLDRGWGDTGVKVLEPGEKWGGAWEISVGDI
jgi:aldose 1-epimerase